MSRMQQGRRLAWVLIATVGLAAVPQSMLVSVAQPPGEPTSSVCKALDGTSVACTPGGTADKIWTGVDNLLKSPDGKGSGGRADPPKAGSEPEEGYPKKIEHTPEKEAELRAQEAADREAVKQAALARIAKENDATRSEFARITVEDNSALKLLNEFCLDNEKPSGACMQQVARARDVEESMNELLAKPGAEAYLLNGLKTTWRPGSPRRASTVRMPDARDCREVIVRFMRLDPANLSTQNRLDVNAIEKGWSGDMISPAVVSSNSPQDIRAAISVNEARIAKERPGPGGTAQYEFVKCVYQNRLNYLEGTAPAPVAKTEPPIDPFSLRRDGGDGLRMAQSATIKNERDQRAVEQAQNVTNIENAQDQGVQDGLVKLGNIIAEASNDSLNQVAQLPQPGYLPSIPQPDYVPPSGKCIASPEICRQIETGLPSDMTGVQVGRSTTGLASGGSTDDYMSRQKAMTDAMNAQAQQNAASLAEANFQAQSQTASRCVGYRPGGGGAFGGSAQLTNACSFTLEVKFCYSASERGSDGDIAFSCAMNKVGETSIGAQRSAGISSGGPSGAILWAACPYPATPRGSWPNGSYSCHQ